MCAAIAPVRWRSAAPPAIDEVQAEDTWICEQVQRNLGSVACRPGRYSPRRETGVHHFHRLLGELLQTETQEQST